VEFYTENGHFAFLSPPPNGSLEAVYAVHLRFIGKCVVDFLSVKIELFSLGVMAETRAKIDLKSAILEGMWAVWPTLPKSLAQNFRYKGSSSTNHSYCRKTRMIYLS